MLCLTENIFLFDLVKMFHIGVMQVLVLWSLNSQYNKNFKILKFRKE